MPAENSFKDFGRSLTGPGTRHANVTPDDANDLTFVSRLLFVGEGGSLVALDEGGRSATYQLRDGAMLPLAARRILATGTTAGNIVAMD